ncbi:hypothetical protein LAV72_00780 [Lysinibacillus xylanilyticus]|uniref:hypothetical protein n=1 Tax=Lysinibacillus xylanilyticus TaxID=582475 RepID=UPI002B24D652|nr:hypothetical protein [Lysinibacillus xylanilyticus]MEB2298159.1 hypothetical protein [Lysinibacillus xylanilyticus]
MLRIVLSLTIFFSVSSSVFAEEQTDTEVYELEGLQKIVLTSDEVIYYEIDEVDVTNPNARGFYKSKTATGRFYLTSSGSTVAEYSLSVTFYYDGKRVLESGNRAWMGNYAKGWSGTAVSGWDWISSNCCTYLANHQKSRYHLASASLLRSISIINLKQAFNKRIKHHWHFLKCAIHM